MLANVFQPRLWHYRQKYRTDFTVGFPSVAVETVRRDKMLASRRPGLGNDMHEQWPANLQGPDLCQTPYEGPLPPI